MRRFGSRGMTGDLTALDMALLPSFSISYGVLGLVQLGALFGGAYLRYVILAVGAALIAQSFLWIDFSGGCVERYSAFVCDNGAAGLHGLGVAWNWVSAAMLGMFGLCHLIWAIKRALR